MKKHTKMNIKKCIVCGDEYLPKMKTQKYCCVKCKRISEAKQKSKKPSIKTCKNCKNKFGPYTSLDKFCSANCRIDYQKNKRSFRWSLEKTEKITGKNNPAYRNGNYIRGKKKISIGEREFIKNSKKLKERMINECGFVFCQNCSTSNSLRFETHHLIFRSEKPLHENLHKTENLIVLCISCHNKFHKKKSLRNEIVYSRKLFKLFGNDVLIK